MANELEFNFGFPITLQFGVNNVTKDAVPTDGTLASGKGAAGYQVPSGCKLHPISVFAKANADLTAGTIDVKVTKDGAELGNGPVANLSDTVQANTGEKRVGSDPVSAGEIMGVSATGSASLNTSTIDVDVIVLAYILQE